MEHIVYIFQKILKIYSIEAAKYSNFNLIVKIKTKDFNFAVSDNQSSKFFYIDNKNFGANSLIKKRFNKE